MTPTLTKTARIDSRYDYHGELKKAIEIADHYGFRLIPAPGIEKEDRAVAERYGCPHEHAAFVRMMLHDERFRNSETHLVAHTRKVPYKNKLELRLEVLGDHDSSAEALLLQATNAILSDYGYKDVLVALNSVGGRESAAPFSQAMHSYLRPRLADLHPECRERVRESIFAPLRCDHEPCQALRRDAPQSLNFLTDQSRQHFREVLEYLESFDIPYVIDPALVGNEQYTTRTVFAIGVPSIADNAQSIRFSQLLAWGERYDHLSKKSGAKKTVPAAHVTIDVGTKNVKERFAPAAKTSAAPAAYVIHVGLPAKIRTLLLGETLRKAHIRVTVTLHKKSVIEQMEHAKALGTPLLLIIGQKEVHDGTVLIRHTATNQQDVVPFGNLCTYLKSAAASPRARR
ncbi:MAG TPA: His/Gly/Thr/Pro-type tRNA ligase C-terminal domain-containing protein [Candidatus Paceibacterota bacterium]|nr:His/Gly/Thr/Pro-type tRNA ligase C-terminal domain-containing protein [Candidatus Paceibacterota bacterium]